MEAPRSVSQLQKTYDDPMDSEPISSRERVEWNTLGDFSALPKELFFQVIDNLKGTELVTTLYTNKKWFMLTSDSALWKKIFDREGLRYFDETKCRTYRGEPGIVPPLSWPREYGFYQSPCTIEPGKKRWETHKLQLFYKELDGEPTTLNLVRIRATTPKPGSGGIDACFHKNSWEPKLGTYGEESLGDAFWGSVVLKPLDYDESTSLEKRFEDAKRHPQYIISTPVQRAIANVDNVVEGNGYIEGPGIYVVCDAKVKHDFGGGEKEVRVALGGVCAPGGLRVLNFIADTFVDAGLALLRKC